MTILFFRTALALTFLTTPHALLADAPQVPTEGTVIYLADNLDEKDNYGWCIDTLGRGFSEQIQAHSCKPQGGDTQFSYDPEAGQIKSVEFDGKCVELVAPGEAVPFGLFDCDETKAGQQFAYDENSMEFHIAIDTSFCVVVGESSAAAGPFMSRNLMTAACADTDPLFKQWIIRE